MKEKYTKVNVEEYIQLPMHTGEASSRGLSQMIFSLHKMIWQIKFTKPSNNFYPKYR